MHFKVADTEEEIPLAAIHSFRISASIDTMFPTGYLLLDDKEGRILSTFAIRPGNLLLIEAEDFTQAGTMTDNQSNDVDSHFFTPMIIVGLENTDDPDEEMQKFISGEERVSTLGGLIKVHLVHPWAVYSSWDSKGWIEGTQISRIVREVLEDTTGRGFGFKSINIESTDDDSGPPRYKLQESEARFIQHKLLPYATAGRLPVYSFVDEQGNFYFKSFKTLYDEESRISFVPAMEEAMAEPETVDLSTAIYPHEITKGYWSVGRDFKSQLEIMKKKIYIEETEGRTTFKANSYYRSPIPGYTLLKTGFLNGLDATSADIIPLRFFNDGIRLSINRNKSMTSFFEIGLTTSLCFEEATVGKPAELRLLSMTDGEAHWANGKWLITAAEHFSQDGVPFTKVLLARPALDNLPSNMNAEEFYKME